MTPFSLDAAMADKGKRSASLVEAFDLRQGEVAAEEDLRTDHLPGFRSSGAESIRQALVLRS
jgi:hypothetical protein